MRERVAFKQRQLVPKIEYKKHNERFEEAQREYLSAAFGRRSQSAYQKMYLVAFDFFHNALVRYMLVHNIFWSDERLNELSVDCTNWILEMYLRRPKFAIHKLSSYGHFSLLKNIAREKNWERLVDLKAEIDAC